MHLFRIHPSVDSIGFFLLRKDWAGRSGSASERGVCKLFCVEYIGIFYRL